eukprot:SAG11_NODE_22972_length_397_cov_0.859060_2_plen_81_part_00
MLNLGECVTEEQVEEMLEAVRALRRAIAHTGTLVEVKTKLNARYDSEQALKLTASHHHCSPTKRLTSTGIGSSILPSSTL